MSNTPKQSTLAKLFEYTWPQNNLLILTLMKETAPKNINKNQHFCFISMVPGERSQESSTGRTFNYEKRMTIKCEPDKVMALSSAIMDCANGMGEQGKFSIFADPSKSSYGNGGETKSLQIAPGNKEGQVALMFKEGQQSVPFIVPTQVAKSIAKICDMTATKAVELEFNRQVRDFDHSNDNGGYAGPGR